MQSFKENIKGIIVESDDILANHRTFHLRVPIKGSMFYSTSSRSHLCFPGYIRQDVTDSLMKIKGLQGFYVHDGYEVKAEKVTAYDWSEIQDEIISILEAHNNTAEFPEPIHEDKEYLVQGEAAEDI